MFFRTKALVGVCQLGIFSFSLISQNNSIYIAFTLMYIPGKSVRDVERTLYLTIFFLFFTQTLLHKVIPTELIYLKQHNLLYRKTCKAGSSNWYEASCNITLSIMA